MPNLKLFKVQDVIYELYSIVDFKNNKIIPESYFNIEYIDKEKIFKATQNPNDKNKKYLCEETFYNVKGEVIKCINNGINSDIKNDNIQPKKENNKKSFSIPNWVYITLMIILVCFLIWFIPYKINKMREQAWLESE